MQTLDDSFTMGNRGKIEIAGVRTLDVAEKYWITNGVNATAKLANEARLDIYREYLESRPMKTALETRAKKKYFEILDAIDDNMIIGFRTLSVGIRDEEQVRSDRYHKRIESTLETLKNMEVRNENSLFLGISQAWTLHKKDLTNPAARNVPTRLLSRHPDDIATLFAASWLKGKFSEDYLSPDAPRPTAEDFVAELEKIATIDFPSKSISLALYDSINPGLFSQVNQTLSRFLLETPKPMPAPMLALLSGLSRNAANVEELNRGFVLGLDVPKEIANRLLIGLTLNQIDPERRKNIQQDQWMKEVGTSMAIKEGVISLGKIENVEDRHRIYQAIVKATILENDHFTGRVGNTAQGFSDYIDRLAVGNWSPSKKIVPEDKVKEIAKALDPIFKLDTFTPENARAAIKKVNSNLAEMQLGRRL